MYCRRMMSFLLILVMAFSLLSINVMAESGIKVVVDGETLIFDVPPQLIEDRTMVPMRKIFEAMGAAVSWNDETQTVTATKGEITVVMQIDNKVISVSGNEIVLDVPPQLVDSRTLVPARAVAESLNATVEWDEATNTVLITSSNKPIEEIYQFPNPTIDFSNDDGTMSQIHLNLRLLFEQSVFPENLFLEADVLKDAFVNEPEVVVAYVDDVLWTRCMNKVIIDYMINSEEEFVINTEEDIYRLLSEMADKFSLHAYQNYEVDAVMLDKDRYMILFSMADIYDDLKVPELDKMLLSNFIAVVYNVETDTFGYYVLERSLDSDYVLCSVNAEGKHTAYGVVKNDKRAFVESVISVSEASE